ncbi:peptidoglycan recognition protein family protein [Streptomyces paludis]|uniref:N-acetylmuramoyl-L-alanine amidase n=1 Tax=Streptomyces paludis TaxID=2282738 RepID=A0A345HNA7_9ACTN|nr:peptidoglycan recognition protein [Streptomyces paludis]AXG78181.1 N-acetylmuramoyl-L-alanine amidase [Streptomyces paludis]
MRAYLATPIGVACTAALVLPLSFPSGATALPAAAGTPVAAAAPASVPAVTVPPGVPGSTQSIPLTALPADRSLGAARERGVSRRDVRPFSLLGVVWDDADTEFHGTVQVRTRAAGTQTWSEWQDLETHNQEHGADPGSQERDSGTVHGSTAPLWVGGSDGVELRVRATQDQNETGPARALLPQGLRLELIDPGVEPAVGGSAEQGAKDTAETPADPATTTGTSTTTGTGTTGERAPLAPMSPEELASSAANEELVASGAREIPALAVPASESSSESSSSAASSAASEAEAQRYDAPRPRIITRRGWGADESLRERNFGYTSTVKAAFVHHSATGNNYTCDEAPSVLRSIYRYHVKSSGWRDFGYNFAVDKCGNIYEGRAGGVAKPVLGAHTLGFNTNSTGIAVLGTYTGTNPPAAAVTALAQLTAWKLGLHGVNPGGKVTLTSGGSGKYGKGTRVTLHTISGHRDGFATECPGAHLYEKLGTVRTKAAGYQGR